jgi:hypothetical protein
MIEDEKIRNEKQETRTAAENKNAELLSGMIILLVYKICYAVKPGINIMVIKAQYYESVFFVMGFTFWVIFFPSIALSLVITILLIIGLKNISKKNNNQKINAAIFIAIILMINPIFLDILIEISVTPMFYYQTLEFCFKDCIYIINGINFVTLMVLLGLIQKEGREKRRIKIKEIILPTIAVGLLVVWLIMAIYKQVKLYPVPEYLGIYDYYFDKIRISTNVIHILFAFIGFIMILEYVIKDLIQRKTG